MPPTTSSAHTRRRIEFYQIRRRWKAAATWKRGVTPDLKWAWSWTRGRHFAFKFFSLPQTLLHIRTSLWPCTHGLVYLYPNSVGYPSFRLMGGIKIHRGCATHRMVQLGNKLMEISLMFRAKSVGPICVSRMHDGWMARGWCISRGPRGAFDRMLKEHWTIDTASSPLSVFLYSFLS